MTPRLRLLAGAAVLVLMSAPTFAQDNQFTDSGSFGDGSFGEAPASSGQPPSPPPANGGFGDSSFGDDTAAAPDSSGDGFGDGSFGDDNFGETKPEGGTDDTKPEAGSFAETDWDKPPENTPPPPPPPEDQVTRPEAPPPPPPPEKPEQQTEHASGPQIDTHIHQFESRDFGVPPTDQLRQSQFHGPTPTQIPGGNVVSTQALVDAYAQKVPMVVIDVLGGQYSLPNAFSAPGMAGAGSFRDRTQQQTQQWLRQITNGNSSAPIVILCSDPMCWLSYNASLRAIAAGYTNVYWYRGGLRAWQMAGLRVTASGY